MDTSIVMLIVAPADWVTGLRQGAVRDRLRDVLPTLRQSWVRHLHREDDRSRRITGGAVRLQRPRDEGVPHRDAHWCGPRLGLHTRIPGRTPPPDCRFLRVDDDDGARRHGHRRTARYAANGPRRGRGGRPGGRVERIRSFRADPPRQPRVLRDGADRGRRHPTRGQRRFWPCARGCSSILPFGSASPGVDFRSSCGVRS